MKKPGWISLEPDFIPEEKPKNVNKGMNEDEVSTYLDMKPEVSENNLTRLSGESLNSSLTVNLRYWKTQNKESFNSNVDFLDGDSKMKNLSLKEESEILV